MPMEGMYRGFQEVAEVFQQPLVVLEGQGVLEGHQEEGAENLEYFGSRRSRGSRWTSREARETLGWAWKATRMSQKVSRQIWRA